MMTGVPAGGAPPIPHGPAPQTQPSQQDDLYVLPVERLREILAEREVAVEQMRARLLALKHEPHHLEKRVRHLEERLAAQKAEAVAEGRAIFLHPALRKAQRRAAAQRDEYSSSDESSDDDEAGVMDPAGSALGPPGFLLGRDYLPLGLGGRDWHALSLNPDEEDLSQYVIHPDKIRRGEDRRTTVFVSEIHNRVTREEFTKVLDDCGLAERYHYVHMPLEHLTGLNHGYATVDFEAPHHVLTLYESMAMAVWHRLSISEDLTASVWYARLQHHDQLEYHYKPSTDPHRHYAGHIARELEVVPAVRVGPDGVGRLVPFEPPEPERGFWLDRYLERRTLPPLSTSQSAASTQPPEEQFSPADENWVSKVKGILRQDIKEIADDLGGGKKDVGLAPDQVPPEVFARDKAGQGEDVLPHDWKGESIRWRKRYLESLMLTG